MAFWNTFRDQLLALWGQWSAAQRVGFSGAAFACVAAIAGTMIWAAQPEFVVIASHLTPQKSAERKPGFDFRTAAALGKGFWQVTAIGAAMMMARFSEAFLILKASDSGFSNAWVPLIMVVMSVVYSLSSYPAGVLSDRIGRRGLLVAGLIVLVAADAVLAFGTSIPMALFGVALWGLHMGLTQGGLTSMVADTAPVELRGTAYGAFNLASGVALLIGSVLAGLLWDAYGPQATFLCGGAFAILTLTGLAWMKPRQPQHGEA